MSILRWHYFSCAVSDVDNAFERLDNESGKCDKEEKQTCASIDRLWYQLIIVWTRRTKDDSIAFCRGLLHMYGLNANENCVLQIVVKKDFQIIFDITLLSSSCIT